MLSRDAVLRKTMLDECKGERLEDVLASFSTAVLKKVAMQDAAATGQHPATALSLALETKSYQDERTDLTPLILAHKVSLHNIHRRREEAAARFRDFSDLLDLKERGIVRRREVARQRDESDAAVAVSDDEVLDMWRTVRNNWSGNKGWMETLIYGDACSTSESLFDMPFDRVWRRVEQDRLGELEASDTGLLEQLDSRVRKHQERLQKWQSQRRNMFRGHQSADAGSPSKPKAPRQRKGIDLGFGSHEDLRPGGTLSEQTRTKKLGLSVNDDYRSLLDGLKTELADVDGPSDPLAFLHMRRRTDRLSSGTQRTSGGEISELSELDDEGNDAAPEEPTIKPFQADVEGIKRLPVRPKLAHAGQSSGESTRASSASAANVKVPSPGEAAGHSSRQSPSPAARASPSLDQWQAAVQHVPGDDIPLSPARETAHRIFDSGSHPSPSPSPTKRNKPRHTLSLEERTRLSMVPRNSWHLDEEDGLEPEATMTTSSGGDGMTRTAAATATDGAADEKNLAGDLEPEDLVGRTRRSMAGFDKARQKAQLERRRSQRKSRMPPPRREGSHFPAVDEEAAEKSALTEHLLGEEDMEAVFRPRPKIKASPLPSPTRELEFEY